MRCLGIFGLLFGHRMEPRYDTEEHTNPSPPTEPVVVLAIRAEEVRNFYVLETKTYVGDVCLRCGVAYTRKQP